MSGIVGIINIDGQPILPELLQRMTDSLGFRGPDAQTKWIDGSVGFGHAMFRTTFESEIESQPCSLDGKVWITADARIDGRSDLITLLESAGCSILSNPTDPELILHAWNVWGEECLDHLIGDFSFAIWDNLNQWLFCARDHFGIKPLYYSHTQNCLIFSNTIKCILMHPHVTSQLNEQAIGDFLLWGSNKHPETTFYSGVNRLPAAHKLSYANGNLSVSRYWRMPIEDEIHYKRSSEYIEHFTELLDTAVRDRLRTDSMAIQMSGGIDSPAVAATAKKIFSEQNNKYCFEAFTVVFNSLIADEERYYAGLVAEKLGMPINFMAADDYHLFEGWDNVEMRTPEPVYDSRPIVNIEFYRQIVSGFRVCLTGEGGDVILRPSFSHVVNLMKNLELYQVVVEIAGNIIKNRRLPRIGFRTRLRKIFGRKAYKDYYPRWLNREFDSRINLRRRWEDLASGNAYIHPYRPEAYSMINKIYWTNTFENYDPGNSNFNIEHRHPLFDLRLVKYSMRVPSIPWCVDKKLIRESMAGKLPEQILNRTKTPLAGFPEIEIIKRERGFVCPREITEPAQIMSRYVKWDQVMLFQPNDPIPQEFWVDFHPLYFNNWIKHSYSNLTAELG
ncbi:MAG: asparagine synthetase B [Acidobacteriota bacterium]|nr:MAG: asparagine synthetase B [Acidobacteriota bacterium]